MSIKDFKLGRGGIPDEELNKEIVGDLSRLLSFISENPGEIPLSDVVSKLESIQSDMRKLDSHSDMNDEDHIDNCDEDYVPKDKPTYSDSLEDE